MLGTFPLVWRCLLVGGLDAFGVRGGLGLDPEGLPLAFQGSGVTALCKVS